MRRADWRAASSYEDLRSLDAPGFAWEFLRRNPEFQQHHRKLDQAARKGKLTEADKAAFAERWGLRFRRWRGTQRPRRRTVDTASPAKRRRSG
jgi:hypothetical protein